MYQFWEQSHSRSVVWSKEWRVSQSCWDIHLVLLTFLVPTCPAGLWTSLCTFSLFLLVFRPFLRSSFLLLFLAHVLVVGSFLSPLPPTLTTHLKGTLQTFWGLGEATNTGIALKRNDQWMRNMTNIPIFEAHEKFSFHNKNKIIKSHIFISLTRESTSTPNANLQFGGFPNNWNLVFQTLISFIGNI